MAGALGAEVSGVDLRAPLDDATRGELRAAWLEHLVLVFRDQPVELPEFHAFAAAFGEPVEYPFVPGLPGHPTIIEVAKLPDETVNFGGIWHSDTTYLECPPMASTLVAREVPPDGGDTMFANQYAAFEALTPARQTELLTLRGVSTSSMADVSATREDRRRDADADGYDAPAEEFEAIHPVVRTHPETGRRSLYVNVAHTSRFEGMTEEESRPLLQFLFDHQVQREFTCRLRWEVGTIALRRVMHRITLAGDRPA
jgi:taurine dioxygenase